MRCKCGNVSTKLSAEQKERIKCMIKNHNNIIFVDFGRNKND